MIEDIFTTPQKLLINSVEYLMEFDNRAYAMLEDVTKKGLFKIYDLLVSENNLSFNDCIELVCCGLLKHNPSSKIAEVKNSLLNDLSLLSKNNKAIMGAFIKPLLPPEVLQKEKTPAKKPMTKSVKKTPKN